MRHQHTTASHRHHRLPHILLGLVTAAAASRS